MEDFLLNLKNNFDFFVRTHFSFSRKNYVEKNESKEGLCEIEREKILYEKYDLEYLKNNSTMQNYLENLYTLDLLDRYFTPHLNPLPKGERKNNKKNYELGEGESQTILDIGCKNWAYVKSEYAFFKKYCNKGRCKI